jgi:fibronectin type 3 domain-containing protein
MVMILMMVGHTEAAKIRLEWDPPPVQVAGYKLYYGRNSRDYTMVIDVGNQTAYTLTGLAGDRGYYFTVTAYDEKGNESDFASEVSTFLTTPNSELQESMAPDTTYSAGEGARNEHHGTALQTGSAVHAADRQSLENASLPHLMVEQIESGEISVDHEWERVEFRKVFVDPIVVARVMGTQHAHPAVSWIRGVGAEGFEVRLGSWNDPLPLRPMETVSYLVIERGEYGLPNGVLLEAGSVDLEPGSSVHAVVLSQRFDTIPVVISSISDMPEEVVGHDRLLMVDNAGFELLTEAALQNQHTPRPPRVDYIAWEPSSGAIEDLKFEISRLDYMAGETSQTILFRQTFEETPVFLADLQGLDTGDALSVCWDHKSADGVEVSLLSFNGTTTGMLEKAPQLGYIAVWETLHDKIPH